jgi:DNA-binding CsgD family transcriptional regulator
MGQTDTLLDFGQEECIDLGQESAITSNDLSDLEMVAAMSDLEEYKYASYILSAFPETVRRPTAVARLRYLRYHNKIRFLKDGVLYLYNVLDVIRNVPDIDINKLVTLCPARKHKSPTTRENLVGSYESKENVKCILKTFNVTKTTFYRTLRRHNVAASRGREKLNVDIQQEIVRMYLNGSISTEISAKLNVSATAVRKYIRLAERQGVINPIIRPREHIQTVLRYYKSGMNAIEISEKLKLSRTSVRRYLRNSKLKLRHKSTARFSKEKVDTILKLYKENMTMSSIAKFLNISWSTVRKYLTKEGLITNDTTHT